MPEYFQSHVTKTIHDHLANDGWWEDTDPAIQRLLRKWGVDDAKLAEITKDAHGFCVAPDSGQDVEICKSCVGNKYIVVDGTELYFKEYNRTHVELKIAVTDIPAEGNALK